MSTMLRNTIRSVVVAVACAGSIGAMACEPPPPCWEPCYPDDCQKIPAWPMPSDPEVADPEVADPPMGNPWVNPGRDCPEPPMFHAY